MSDDRRNRVPAGTWRAPVKVPGVGANWRNALRFSALRLLTVFLSGCASDGSVDKIVGAWYRVFPELEGYNQIEVFNENGTGVHCIDDDCRKFNYRVERIILTVVYDKPFSYAFGEAKKCYEISISDGMLVQKNENGLYSHWVANPDQ